MQQRILFSIGIISVTIIAFQLVLMQILSIVQWYHFAYMIISMALLGFGAGGTFLAIFRKWSMRHFEILLPVLMILTGLAMAVVVNLSQSEAIRFDSFLLFDNITHAGRLVITYLLFFLPFFTGALAIGLVFVRMVSNIGNVYFANLLGSGIGGFVAIGLMWMFLPNYLPAILSLFAVVAGIIVMPERSRWNVWVLAFLSLAIIFYFIAKPPDLILSEYKSLSKTMDLPDAKIVLSKSSPLGLIQLVSTPALRYAPGLSLNYVQVVPVGNALFENGNWYGPLIPWGDRNSPYMMDFTANALPYIMKERGRVLVLNAGTGVEVAHALVQNAKDITAVEPNGVVLSLFGKELAEESDSLYHQQDITIKNITPRTYLMAKTGQYDLINLPMIGAFGGAGGLNALQEQYILTVESFEEMWNQLARDGTISISCWMDYPYRYPLKVLATIIEMLTTQGIDDPVKHVAAIRSWGTISFVVKKTPVTQEENRKVRDFCSAMSFDPAILSELAPEERSLYNTMQDEQFFDYLDQILSPDREIFYDTYDFNIRPATDNRPYFSQFIKWKSLSHLADLFGAQSLPFFEIGYLIVIITLMQIVIIAVILIILPLFYLDWKGKAKRWVVLYFGGLGLGYMFVEITMIQRFTLYFGNPIYSAAAVISFMLVCSGIGSYYSSRLKTVPKTFLLVLGVIISLLMVHAFFLTPILQNTISWPLPLKIIIAFLLISLTAFMMGMPFPLGLVYLSKRNEDAVPWAWGINGCLSVISAALAIVVAVEVGFAWVMIMAAVAYCLPLVANVGKAD